MIAVINDISFQYTYDAVELAMQNIRRFLDIYKRIKKGEMTNIEKDIKRGTIDAQIEISQGYKLIQLVQEFQTREERTLLLGALVNGATDQEKGAGVCIIDGKESAVCVQAIDNFLLSLLSNEIFSRPVIQGNVGEKRIELRNLSTEQHIDYYRNELGLRRYIANDKKHKFDRENSYGKGKVASRMDLREEEAQELLNKAVYIKGRLYAKKRGYYYAFQKEGDINYHGYRVDDLGEDIRRNLDRMFD